VHLARQRGSWTCSLVPYIANVTATHEPRGPYRDATPAHAGHGASGDPRALVTALVLIALYMIVEVAVSLLSHSLALLADAGHMLTDAGALAGAMWAIRLAARPTTPAMSYGFKRAEILAAAANGVTLLVVAMLLLVASIQRLVHPSAVHGVAMLVVACVGIAVNIAATWVLSRADRRSLNVRGAYLHIVTDLFGLVATAIAAVVIIATRWEQIDPIATLVVVALVLRAAWSLLTASGRVLLEGTPKAVDLGEVRRHLIEVPDVVAVHDLHAWTLTSDLPALTAHVVVTDRCLNDGSAARILDRLQSCLTAHFDVKHSTFQLEAEGHAQHESGAHD
jgi:cobalt-zinc-cadmium efflux system protein